MSNAKFRGKKPKQLFDRPDVVATAAATILVRTILLMLEQGMGLLRPFVSQVQRADGTVSVATAFMQIFVVTHKGMVANLQETGLMQHIVDMPEAADPNAEPGEVIQGPGAEDE